MPDSPDLSQRLLAQLRFPCGDVPDPGAIKNVAPGIFWLRMPLPFQLNHINLWLVEEKDGWTIVDTGDYDSDAKSDILWRDNVGNVAMWFLNGTSIAGSVGIGNVSTAWQIQSLNVD